MRDRAKAVRPAAVEAARRDPLSGPLRYQHQRQGLDVGNPIGRPDRGSQPLFVREHPGVVPGREGRPRADWVLREGRAARPTEANVERVERDRTTGCAEDAKIVWDAAREKREKQDAARKQRQKENKPPSE